jgi:hypothetical protein
MLKKVREVVQLTPTGLVIFADEHRGGPSALKQGQH